ncbi:hypothetical protein NP233_g1818 [Leucocoprinus birnbaumii]|uniref:Uncharacterized protein n=1 Tax=Leucocoprinus birnbaumii TaxID=56174 RepID=A0AAD5W2G2_9AGAR|nr:hypothetical protein NP233_g1818 [Leucocoprinus birnbaumii]
MAQSQTRVFEHAYYVGGYIGGILYGLELALYFVIMRKLRKHKSGSIHSRKLSAAFCTVGLALLTINISCNAVWGETMWIEARGSQAHGVETFIMTQVSAWYETLSSTCAVGLIFMGDALLLYRLFIVWGSNFLIIVIPALAYLAAFVLAIIQLVISGTPGGNFFHGQTIAFGTPYYSITIGLNIIITFLICGRLIHLVGGLSRSPENCHVLHFYSSLTSLMIESAALYSLLGITYLIPYASESQTAIAFGQVWSKLTCICPQLIILRMASGKAWDKRKVSEAMSTLQGRSVAPQPPLANRGTEIEGTRDSDDRKSSVDQV